MEEYWNIYNEPIDAPPTDSVYYVVFHDGDVRYRVMMDNGNKDSCVYEGISKADLWAYHQSKNPGIEYQLIEGNCIHYFLADGQYSYRKCTRHDLGPDLEVEEEFDADGTLLRGQAYVKDGDQIRYAIEFDAHHKVFNVYSFAEGGPVALEEVAEWIALIPNQA